MNERIPDIQPETRTLKELSAARLTQGRKQCDGTRRRTLLLLKTDCDEWPSALLFERVLQPADKVVLLLAITIARQTEDAAYLPPQTTLATMANVSSPDALEAASTKQDIAPFAALLGGLVQDGLEGRPPGKILRGRAPSK